jgi:hypothetical protein
MIRLIRLPNVRTEARYGLLTGIEGRPTVGDYAADEDTFDEVDDTMPHEVELQNGDGFGQPVDNCYDVTDEHYPGWPHATELVAHRRWIGPDSKEGDGWPRSLDLTASGDVEVLE